MTQTVELPQVVKDYIRDLPKEKQDRLLTGRLVHAGVFPGRTESDYTSEGCLVQLAEASKAAPFAANLGNLYFTFDAFAREAERAAGRTSVFVRGPIPNAAAIVRDYVLELRAEEIVGSGNASVPVERRWVPQVVAIGLSLLMVFV